MRQGRKWLLTYAVVHGATALVAEDEFLRWLDYQRAEAIRAATMRIYGCLPSEFKDYADEIKDRGWPH